MIRRLQETVEKDWANSKLLDLSDEALLADLKKRDLDPHQLALDEDIMSKTTQSHNLKTPTYNTNQPATTAPTKTLATAFSVCTPPTPAPSCA